MTHTDDVVLRSYTTIRATSEHTFRPMTKSLRHRGQITNWNDKRGFGFITQSSDGEEVFVHVSAFINRNRRPKGNETVTYHAKPDARGRKQAFRVWFADEATNTARSGNGSFVNATVYATAFAGLFITGVAGLTLVGKLPFLVFVLYSSASLVAFMTYAWDKTAAQKARWRTAERTLHLLGLVGGWPGALVARHLFRHKSKKKSFTTAFWGTVVLNSIVLVWFLTPQGHKVLESIMRGM